MLAVNLGTGTPEEARDWLEYCNSPAGTKFADMRVANGFEDPHNVPVWCLGNEMDGPWQLGHVPASQYAIRAQQAAKMMRDTDNSIRTVACGSSFPGMPTYLSWDNEVLDYLGSQADYISLHRYVGNSNDSTSDFLALSNSIDSQIEGVDACARFIQQKNKLDRRAYLCFDEWNVWYRARGPEHTRGRDMFAPPLLEEQYNLEDALVVAMFLMSFVRHADSVKIANLAQLVNVIAPILTKGDQLVKQSIYYAFQMISKRKRGIALDCIVEGSTYTSERYGEVKLLDQAAILDGNLLHVFLLNRHLDEPLETAINVNNRTIVAVESSEILAGELKAANTFDNPDTVVSRSYSAWSLDGSPSAQIPPHSFLATTFRIVE